MVQWSEFIFPIHSPADCPVTVRCLVRCSDIRPQLPVSHQVHDRLLLFRAFSIRPRRLGFLVAASHERVVSL